MGREINKEDEKRQNKYIRITLLDERWTVLRRQKRKRNISSDSRFQIYKLFIVFVYIKLLTLIIMSNYYYIYLYILFLLATLLISWRLISLVKQDGD